MSQYAANIWDHCRNGNQSMQIEFVDSFIDVENIKTERDLNTICCGIATARINAKSEIEKRVADSLIKKLSKINFENYSLNNACKLTIEAINNFITENKSLENCKKLQYLKDS